jgi:hypothetical protein
VGEKNIGCGEGNGGKGVCEWVGAFCGIYTNQKQTKNNNNKPKEQK